MSAQKFLNIQQQLSTNQTELQDYLKGLESWEDEIKEKESRLSVDKSKKTQKSDKDLPPIRNSLDKKKKKKRSAPAKSQSKRISGYDFAAWDKFDTDKACQEVDDISEECSDNDTDDEAEELRLKQQALLMKDEGNQYFKEGKYEAAIECYTRGITCDPLNALLPANRAMALIKMEKFSAAEMDCSESLSLDPTYLKSYQRRGTARLALKKLKEAKEDFQHILKQDPKNKQAKSELEKIAELLNPPIFSTSADGELGIIHPISKSVAQRSKNPLKRIKIEEAGIEHTTNSGSSQSGRVREQFGESPGQEVMMKNVENQFKKYTDPNWKSNDIQNTPRNGTSTVVVGDPPDTDATPSTQPEESKTNTTAQTSSDRCLPAGSQEPDCTEGHAGGSSRAQENKKVCDKFDTVAKSTPRITALPNNSFQFQSDWKVLKFNPEGFFHYVMKIDPVSYPQLFGQSFDYEVLKKMLNTLKDYYIPRQLDIFPVLKNLTLVKRFDMIMLFMPSDDKKVLKTLMEHLKSNHDLEEELAGLAQAYGL